MTSPMQYALKTRTSIHHFQPERPLDDTTLATLIEQATLAPSAYHLQNWRFIAVRAHEAKTRLQAAAFGQQKIVDASVSIIICGQLAAHRHLRAALQPSLDAGIMTPRAVDAWGAQASATHADNPVLQRDEAVRSATLAAMALMLAAQDMGLSSCPMSGFDAALLAQTFALGSDELPVMIVTIGHASAGNWPQKPRKPVVDVLTIV